MLATSGWLKHNTHMETSPSSERDILDVLENIDQGKWDIIAHANYMLNVDTDEDEDTKEIALSIVREQLVDRRFIDEQMRIVGLGRTARKATLDLAAMTGRYDGLAVIQNSSQQAEQYSLPEQIVALRVTDELAKPPRRYYFPLQRSSLVDVRAEAPAATANILRLHCREIENTLRSANFRRLSKAEKIEQANIFIDNLNSILHQDTLGDAVLVRCRRVLEHVKSDGHYSVSELLPESRSDTAAVLSALSEGSQEEYSEIIVRGTKDETNFVLSEDGKRLLLLVMTAGDEAKYWARPEDIVSVIPEDVHDIDDGLSIDIDDILSAVDEELEQTGCLDLMVEVRRYDTLPGRAVEAGWSIVAPELGVERSDSAKDDVPKITTLYIKAVSRYSSRDEDEQILIMTDMLGDRHVVRAEDIISWHIETE